MSLSGEHGLSEPFQRDIGEGGEFGSSGASREIRVVRTAQSGLWVKGKDGGPVRARDTPGLKWAALCARNRAMELTLLHLQTAR